MVPKIPLVVGSVAYDYIFEISSHIRHELPLTNGRLPDNLQLAFSADDATVLRGGTGGNITYGLAILEDNPMFVSAAGKDFNDYKKSLEKLGCHVAVKIFSNKDTAHCYQVNDPNNEQIIIWQSNAYKYASKVDLRQMLDVKQYSYPYAIFSPGSSTSTPLHIDQCKEITPATKVMFDPGQMTMSYDASQFRETLRKADILIVNDAEIAKIKANHGLPKKAIFELGLTWIIETCGKKGSKFYHRDGRTSSIGIIKPKQIADPTGAGDAYRAGLIHGLMQGFPLPHAAKFGAVMSKHCLETKGAQTYSPTIQKVKKLVKEVPDTLNT